MDRFYPEMVDHLLQYPLNSHGIDIKRYEKVFFFFDRMGSTRNQQQGLVAAVKNIYQGVEKGLVTISSCMARPRTATFNS